MAAAARGSRPAAYWRASSWRPRPKGGGGRKRTVRKRQERNDTELK